MDLCNKVYGFIHLPSLIVFVNPFSPHKSVKDFMLNEISLDNVESLVNTLPREEGVDLLHRLSSLFHERKHFHDLLITPFGNRLVRLGFKYALAAALTLSDRNWEPDSEVELPLGPGTTKDARVLERAQKFQQEFISAFHSARLTLEASATLAQLQFIWTVYGANSAYAAYDDFAGSQDYSKVLHSFNETGKKLSFGSEWYSVFAHQLLLISLGSDEPLGNHDSHDAFLTDIFRRAEAFPPREAQRRLAEAVKRGWEVVESNMEIADKDNERFLEELERLRSKYPSAIYEGVLPALRDFCSKSRVARSNFLDNRDDYFSLRKYVLNDPIKVGPLVYMYSDEDELSLSKEPLSLDTEDIVATAKYEVGEDGPVYSYRLQPGELSSEVPLDKYAWVNFAKGPAGAVTLLEQIDWLHPLQSYWLRGVEPLVKIRFSRRWH
jgi:hypothetical protein